MVASELVRVKGFQHIAVFVAETGKPTGNVTGMGIVDDGIDGLFQIKPR